MAARPCDADEMIELRQLVWVTLVLVCVGMRGSALGQQEPVYPLHQTLHSTAEDSSLFITCEEGRQGQIRCQMFQTAIQIRPPAPDGFAAMLAELSAQDAERVRAQLREASCTRAVAPIDHPSPMQQAARQAQQDRLHAFCQATNAPCRGRACADQLLGASQYTQITRCGLVNTAFSADFRLVGQRRWVGVIPSLGCPVETQLTLERVGEHGWRYEQRRHVTGRIEDDNMLCSGIRDGATQTYERRVPPPTLRLPCEEFTLGYPD